MKKFLILALGLFFIIGCGPAVKPTAEDAPKVAAVEKVEEKQDFVYESEKYSFGLRTFPKDFKAKYLSDEVGVVFEKFAVPPKNPNKKDPYENYTAQIYVVPFENIENYKDLNDFISKKYNGYTFQFADYGTISGFYVNDGVYVEATVHFFAMSKDKNIIYDAYLKLPSRYYLLEKDVFENLMKNMVLL